MKTIAIIIIISIVVYHTIRDIIAIKKYKKLDDRLVDNPEYSIELQGKGTTILNFQSNPEMVKRMCPNKRTRYEFKQSKAEFQKWIQNN
jgi:hypothetical protein